MIAIVFAAVVWLFLRGSVFGYEMSIIGSSPRAATYAGMPTKRIMLIVFALGGVAAGLAGVTEMLTNVQRYGPALSNNLGYTGVVVAVLAGGFGPRAAGAWRSCSRSSRSPATCSRSPARRPSSSSRCTG